MALTEKRELLKIVGDYKIPVSTIYDCGSRDARDGIELGQLFKAKEVHFFECNPTSLQMCRDNVDALQPKTFMPVLNGLALGDRKGVTSFFAIDPKLTITPHADGNVGASSLLKASSAYKKEKYVQQEIQVEMTTLEDYLTRHKLPDILWMDLQGAEFMALRGLGSAISKISVVHVEVGFRPMYAGQALFAAVDGLLSKDFDLVHIDLGRWPKLLWLYRALRTGPWVANAIYVNRAWSRPA